MSNKFTFKLLTSADPKGQYAAIAAKDPMTFYLLNNGVGYLGDVKLFDVTEDGLLQTISDESTNTTDAASVKAIVDYVSTKVSEINTLKIKFFRTVDPYTLKEEDLLEGSKIKVHPDAKVGDPGLLFTVDGDNDKGEDDEYFFISLVNYLNIVHSFADSNTVKMTVGENNEVTAEVKIDSNETVLKAGENGLFIEKVTEDVNEETPTDSLITEKALVSYIQKVLSDVVTYTVDDGSDT